MTSIYITMVISMFRRKAYDTLKAWKEKSRGSTAILVEGARRVGKTTLVQEFAKREYSTHIVVDFYRAGKDIKRLFDNLTNLDEFFLGLQMYYGKKLIVRGSVIIFDEVQLFPRAREAIKALVNDGRYDYIETGSLVSIKKNVKNIIVPSEEEKLKLHPLDFEEFLWARGINTFRLLYEHFEKKTKLDEKTHLHMMKLFREYLAVGGMPQAVEKFIETGNYREVDKVKRNIIHLYLDDFRKMDPRGKLGRLYLSIPSKLSSQSNRYRMTDVIPNGRMKREMKTFFDLEDSQTVQMCRHVNDPRVGFTMTTDDEFFKMFTEDTGLFVTLCFYDKQFTDNVIYSKLVSGRLSANLGYVYENVTAQLFTAMGFNLCYFTFKKGTDEKHSYEIDFLMSIGDKVCPIEIKSSYVSAHKSLDVFISKYGLNTVAPVVLSPKNLDYSNGILYLPIYMIQFLDGNDYGSEVPDNSFVGEYSDDDWIPADGGYILYLRGKDHGKKNPIVDIYNYGADGSMQPLDVLFEIDSNDNVKLFSKKMTYCHVRITERDERALDSLRYEINQLLDKLDFMQSGQGNYTKFKNEVKNVAHKVYPSDVIQSKVSDIDNVGFVSRVTSTGEDPTKLHQREFDRGKEKMKGLLTDMMKYLAT